MTTDENMPGPVNKSRDKLVRLIIVSGWALTLLTMISILGTAMGLLIFKEYVDLPEILKQWGSIALGFLFGSFSKIVADYVGDESA